ncbi:cytochrome P450 [Lophiostoma macrostomum CBS 122681]|uniref:Cytochrome P450 n=1 Tax=Lophiostoma macrostomum CBS 122681 TaxID=1314788 RepID=A0A6A6TET3_9PLEO|nr:cytochrome P450 [Lophiostoma macrostomum CBS 122681]
MGLPLLGNIFDMPKPGTIEALHWSKRKQRYGPISSVTVMGKTMIIVNDAKVAFDLLDKRSINYSSRPRQVFAGEMLGWVASLGVQPYDDRFRSTRKVIKREIGSKSAASRYDKAHEIEVAHFLLRLAGDPKDLTQCIKKSTGSLAPRTLYGYVAEPVKEDPLIDLVERAMDTFTQATAPGAFLVDTIPLLKYLPQWMPGSGFKKLARKWRPVVQEMNSKPYAFVRSQLAKGFTNHSYAARLIQAGEPSMEISSINEWSASALFGGAGDTIIGSLLCFFLAMGTYPEVQRRAQAEIDRVVEQDRLPTMSDKPNLPYMEAVILETLRWHPISPIPLAHECEKDDVYGGYPIPKGALIMANVWQMTHEPDVYSDPMAFRPERYMPVEDRPAETDPSKVMFGFGRRACPGRVLGENALFFYIAQTLATFNIKVPENVVAAVGNGEGQETLRFTREQFADQNLLTAQ